MTLAPRGHGRRAVRKRQEFTEIGTEGTRHTVPFERAAKTVVVHISPALRATFKFGHGYFPTPLPLSPHEQQP